MQRFIFTRKTTNTIAPFVDIEKGIGGGEDGKTKEENDNKKIKAKYYNENCFKFKIHCVVQQMPLNRGGQDMYLNSIIMSKKQHRQRRDGKADGTGKLRKSLRILQNVATLLEDWLLLALLGILVALCSLIMDMAIEYLQTWHVFFIEIVRKNTQGHLNLISTYSVWAGYMLILVLASAFFVRLISPSAIGSGIPEMKTILRGVILKEFLTLKTLLSKMVGLTLSLGSGLPIGKEGPFVHIASVVANQLSHCVHSIKGAYSNESRSFEMLAAACAVGVSSTFSAPVGGVLFSIEVTAAYFAVRNYWRGFFAATCSTVLFRILRVLLVETEVTVTAFYQTQFPRDAFLPEELPIFSIVGVICGFVSAAFIFLQRRCVIFLRYNSISKFFLHKHWSIYPILIALIIGSITYPQGFGQFLGGEKKFMYAAKDFFADCTFSLPNNSNRACPEQLISSWTREDYYTHFTTLPIFIGVYFILTILASTLPIPAGIFGPSFVLGAAIGRFIGEIMASLYPSGLRGPNDLQIFPGVYAIVGSAALTGGVTHTVSVAVIVFELTGQLLHILPVMIAVLIANAICSNLQPSIYDSAIKLKQLPYLPDIPQTSSRFHGILVEQFMTCDIKFLSNSTTYAEMQEVLFDNPKLKAFPIVENEETRILIGSCSRSRLIRILNNHVGPMTRKQEAIKRINTIDRRKNSQTTTKKESLILSPSSNIPLLKFLEPPKDQKHSIVEFDKINSITKTKSETLIEGKEEEENVNKNNILQQKQSLQQQYLKCLNRPSISVKRSLTIPASLSHSSSSSDVYSTIGDMIRTLSRFSQRFRRGVDQNGEIDLVGDERTIWEQEQLAKRVDFRSIGIDPAPFQLVEETSLFKVHSLFSMLGLNRAYVTKCGRLVGVVALRDLRLAVELIQSGDLIARKPSIISTESSEEGEEENLSKTFISNLEEECPVKNDLQPKNETTNNEGIKFQTQKEATKEVKNNENNVPIFVISTSEDEKSNEELKEEQEAFVARQVFPNFNTFMFALLFPFMFTQCQQK
uniref:Chloride channel protein n=4 Tax=Meloidogyne incognita group TaxID=654580 RepID=A0A914L5C6_MELIC